MSQMTPSTTATLENDSKVTAHGDRSPLDHLKHNFREYGMLITLVAIMAFFQVMTDGTLMQPLNLTNLILQN
ncbi:MAG: sugar ABC transporter permease, partial [Gammaproteobacteria bacterium]|nr:sugar ABC transporter permease [Gammaproteobacteria bacterium]